MTTAKVSSIIDIEKIKAEKRLTACKCKVLGCDKIGLWNTKKQNFYLINGMCQMHYRKYKAHGSPLLGIFIDGRTNNPLFHTWYNLRKRITNPKSKDYPSYGGRGLRMEESWIPEHTGFWQFVKDIAYLGERPEGYSLDRIENDLGYITGNLRWATIHQQCRNRRSNNKIVGVYFNKQRNKWNAKLQVNGVKFLDAYFITEQEAIKARKDEEVLHGIFY